MWVFLGQEVMFFGGLFLAYLVYRVSYPGVFAEASHHLDVVLGGVNTAILIASSLTMALGVYGAQSGKRSMLIFFLVATILKFFGPALLKEFEKRMNLYATLLLVLLVGGFVALKYFG